MYIYTLSTQDQLSNLSWLTLGLNGLMLIGVKLASCIYIVVHVYIYVHVYMYMVGSCTILRTMRYTGSIYTSWSVPQKWKHR